MQPRTSSRRRAHEVDLDDLHAEGFDPVESPRFFPDRAPGPFDPQAEQRRAHEAGTTAPDVARELERLRAADLVVFQFPMWWHAQPGMLKGWLDRVLTYGGLFTGSERYDRGMLRGRRALLSVTAGAPESTFLHDGRSGELDLLLWPMAYSLFYVGLDVLPHQVAYEISGAIAYGDADGTARRDRYEAELRACLRSAATDPVLPFNGWDDLGPDGRLRPGVRGTSAFVRDDLARIPGR